MENIFKFLLIFISVPIFAQTTFGPVEKHGFGILGGNVGYNSTINSLSEFKGKLYASTGSDSGYVYRSATGDLGSFTKVYSEYGISSVCNLATTLSDGGNLFMATSSSAQIGNNKVMRTLDGTSWDTYFVTNSPYENILSINAFSGLQAFDSIYVAKSTSMGILLLRNSVLALDANNSLLSWDTVATESSPFGQAGGITASTVFGGRLFYATGNNKLFQTADGQSLSENSNYETSMGYSGLSGVNNVTSMETFGGSLYLGTFTSFNGAQIWRTTDGVTFDSLAIPSSSMSRVVSIKATGSKLWVILGDGSGYFEVYSTTDGINYSLEENNRFGNTLNNSQGGMPVVEFNNHLYIGCKNNDNQVRLASGPNTIQEWFSDGGQIVRTCLVGAMQSMTIAGSDTVTVCAGTSTTFTATAGFSSYLWTNANTSQFLSTITPGNYAVTGIDVNGCRNSDDAFLLNPFSQSAIVYENYYQVYNSVVCSGDTTAPITALDPNNDYNCVLANGSNTGITTPTGPSLLGSGFTIEAWIKPTSNGVIASQYDPSSNWYANNNAIMWVGGSTNELYVSLEGIGNTFVGYLSQNQWNHVALRYNSSTLTLDGFVNGYQGGYAYSGSMYYPPTYWGYTDAFKFMMEANYPGYTPNANGKIRDIRIWNIARTDSAILADKHKLPAGVYLNLINHYKLEETSGSTAADASTSNLTAAVSGTFVSPTPVTWINAPGMNVIGFNTAEFFPTQITQYAFQYTNTYGCLVVDSFKVEPAVLHIAGTPANCGGSGAYLYCSGNVSLNNPTWSSASVGINPSSYIYAYPPTDEWIYMADTVGACPLRDSILVKVGPAFTSGVPGKGPTTHACVDSDLTLDALPSGGTPPYTVIWQVDNLPDDTTNLFTYTYNVGAGYSNVGAYGHDGIGCPFEGPYFMVMGDIASTELIGHISTPPPTSLNVDNGIVYAFKHQPGNSLLDTIAFTSLDGSGNYSFPPLIAGNYLVKVMPDETAFPLSVPTYYGNDFQWDSSQVFIHGCAQIDTADIEIVEIVPSTGTASISGYILEDPIVGISRFGSGGGNNTPFAPGGPLKGIDVKLGKNPGGGIQARTMSDTTGFYQFDSIPVGGYIIYVDIPNFPMDSTRRVTVAATDSSVQNNYYVDSTIYVNPSYVGIFASDKKYENNFSIYPNPTKGTIYLKYQLSERTKVSFEIINSMGQKMLMEQERSYPQGDNIFALDIETLHLNGGVYFVSLISNDKKYTQRIVVID